MICKHTRTYCTHFKETTRKPLQSWRAGSSYCLACKSSQQSVLPLILLDGVSSLCVWRCGLLLVLLLSEEKVHWDSLYRLLSRTGLQWICPGCTGPAQLPQRSALVNLRWSLAQLPDLVERCRLARNAPCGHLVSEMWPLIQIWRPKWGFHRGWS